MTDAVYAQLIVPRILPIQESLLTSSYSRSDVKLSLWVGRLENERECEVAQLCPTLCNSMACSLPGSSIHGIFQAKVLE